MAHLLTTLARADARLSARLQAPSTATGAVWLRLVHRASQTGSYGVGWVAVFAVVVTIAESPAAAAIAAACVLGTLTVNTLVKRVVRRPRPPATTFGHQPTTHSMPSAHTSMAVVGASVMTMVLPGVWFVWWGWALVLAVSRIVLGMHYVGDVVVGALLGLALAVWIAVPVMETVL